MARYIPPHLKRMATQLAAEQMAGAPQPVYDGQLHAAIGDSSMFLAATILYSQMGENMSFYDCTLHMMACGEEFRKAAYAFMDEREQAKARDDRDATDEEE